jgi:hypothetical protein
LRKALDALHALAHAARSGDLARRGIEYLPRLIGSDSPPPGCLATSKADAASSGRRDCFPQRD